jgi:hypothetical protein
MDRDGWIKNHKNFHDIYDEVAANEFVKFLLPEIVAKEDFKIEIKHWPSK